MSERVYQPDAGDGTMPVIRLSQTESTNRYLKERVGEFPLGAIAYTDCQLAGRGRLGRSWETPPHTALAWSMLWYPQGAVQGFPLACAVAALQALEEIAPLSAYIKWPNDIICNNRKVCGILCESGVAEGRPYVIVGVGINLTQSAEWFDEVGLPHGASLLQLGGQEVDADEMATALTKRMTAVIENFEKEGLSPLIPLFRERCCTLDREVQVVAEPPFTGVAVDVDNDGNLLVETEEGLRTVFFGEVSVRGLYGYL